SSRFSAAAAAAWRDLVDDLDTVWQTLRPLGLESELHGRFQLTRKVERILRAGQSVEQLAGRLGRPELAMIIRDLAHRQGSEPRSTPAHCAVEASVLRRFGRWVVRRVDGAEAGRTSALFEILAGRLATRRVTVIDDPVTAIMVDGDRAAGVITASGEHPADAVISTVDPPETYQRLLADVPLRP